MVDAVNQVGATPSALIAILEALKSTGSLRAELIIIWAVAAIFHGHRMKGQCPRAVRERDTLRFAGGARTVDEREGIVVGQIIGDSTGTGGIAPSRVVTIDHDYPVKDLIQAVRVEFAASAVQKQPACAAIPTRRDHLVSGKAWVERDRNTPRIGDTE